MSKYSPAVKLDVKYWLDYIVSPSGQNIDGRLKYLRKVNLLKGVKIVTRIQNNAYIQTLGQYIDKRSNYTNYKIEIKELTEGHYIEGVSGFKKLTGG